MKITYIHIKNFKSIRDLEIKEVENALILVGKNIWNTQHAKSSPF